VFISHITPLLSSLHIIHELLVYDFLYSGTGIDETMVAARRRSMAPGAANPHTAASNHGGGAVERALMAARMAVGEAKNS
jgi:hypothetical protein